MTIIFVVSVCLFVCAEFFSTVFDPILIKLGHTLYVWVWFFPQNIGAVRPLGAGWPRKTCIFRGFGAQKTISSYSFDRIVLILGYIVERKILSSLFLQFPS